ncbi:MAG: late competence development ComFB family protein [Elusimicrobiaceae bacterium]|nr:late competence development ComFB family protein [Elusimicrobiaceae bacterium]
MTALEKCACEFCRGAAFIAIINAVAANNAAIGALPESFPGGGKSGVLRSEGIASMSERRRFHNYMENLVEEELEQILSENPDFCRCRRCVTDVMVLALNRLPAKYASTPKGNIYVKLSTMDPQLETDVVRELTIAIGKVAKNPRH